MGNFQPGFLRKFTPGLTPSSNIQEVEIEKQTIRIKKGKTVTEEKTKVDTIEASTETEQVLFTIDEVFIRDSLSYLEASKIDTIITVLMTFTSIENKRMHKLVSAYKESVASWNKREKASNRNYYDSRYQANTLREPKFINEVSSEQLPRLYRLLDMLFSAFEKIGEEVTNDLNILFGKDIVSFEIIESQDKVNHELTKEEAKQLIEYNDKLKSYSYASKPNIRKFDYIPNGNLRIKLPNGKYVKDTKNSKLEEMIPEIILLFYQCYYDDRIRREAREEAQRIQDEERRNARILQEQINDEKKRTRELLNTIKDYKLAKEIREYVSVLKENQEIDEETSRWMLNKADWIDPIISTEDELLGKRKHYENDEKKEELLEDKKSWY